MIGTSVMKELMYNYDPLHNILVSNILIYKVLVQFRLKQVKNKHDI